MIRIGAGELPVAATPAALRAALALSATTGLALHWTGCRAAQVGPDGAEALRVFAELTHAHVAGGGLDDSDSALIFEPSAVVAGSEQRIEIAGKTPLLPLVRSVLLPLARGAGSSKLTALGSTHAPMGETLESTASTWCHLLGLMGLEVSVSLESAGFAPRGGGELVATTSSATDGQWRALSLTELDPLSSIQIVSAGASLPTHVQQRQAARARSALHLSGLEPNVQLLKLRSRNAGSVVSVTGIFGDLPVTFSSVSQRGRSAEAVGEEAAAAFRRFSRQSEAVPSSLAASLLLFLAFADGRSCFTTPRLSDDVQSVSSLLLAFTGRHVTVEGTLGRPARIAVESLQS